MSGIVSEGNILHYSYATCGSAASFGAPSPPGMKGNRNIRFDEVTPLANLHLSLLDKVGVKIDAFGDSNGMVDGLFQPLSV